MASNPPPTRPQARYRTVVRSATFEDEASRIDPMPERMDERLQAAEWAASTNAEAQAELPPTPYRWVALDGDPPLGVLFTIDDPNTCQLRHVLALDENLGYPDESQLGASYGAEEDDEPEPSA